MSSKIKINRCFSASARSTTLAAGLLLTLASARIAKAATVTVTGTCTFNKAVASINAAQDQSPCTHTGTYGSTDTVVLPVGSVPISSPVDITRSMTIHGGGQWDTYLVTNDPSFAYALKIANPSIVVKIDNLGLSPSDNSNTTTGIGVDSANDTNRSDNNLELNYVAIGGFRASGIKNYGGRLLVQNSHIWFNTAGIDGGGVWSLNTSNSNGSRVVSKFVAKYSEISYNAAFLDGGGISIEGSLDLRSTLMVGNQAEYGAAIYSWTQTGYGASCHIRRDVATAPPSEIVNNFSTVGGTFGYSIVSYAYGMGAPMCSFHDTIGSGNSSPYCEAGTINCPQ